MILKAFGTRATCVQTTIHERIALWRWRINEAARAFFYSVWSDLSSPERSTPPTSPEENSSAKPDLLGSPQLFHFGITCLILWHAGVFDRFWFWTVNYAASVW